MRGVAADIVAIAAASDMVSGSGSGIKTCLWDRKMNGMSFPWWLLHEESFGLTAPLACAPCHCVLSALFDCFVLALHLYRGCLLYTSDAADE